MIKLKQKKDAWSTLSFLYLSQEGNQFLTSQSDAIEKIINVLMNSIDAGLASTESKIQF